jgi:hypothetical protein
MLCRRREWYHRTQNDVELRNLFDAETWTSGANATQRSNCVVISAAWQPRVRYQLQLQALNPGADTDTISTPAPGVWVSMIAGEVSDATTHSLRTTGAGKFGDICRVPASRQSAMSVAFSACALAQQLGLVTTQAGQSPQACIQSIQRQGPDAQQAAIRTSSVAALLKAPPFVDVAQLDGVTAETCALIEAFSPRSGGECISCHPGSIPSDSGVPNLHLSAVLHAC